MAVVLVFFLGRVRDHHYFDGRGVERPESIVLLGDDERDGFGRQVFGSRSNTARIVVFSAFGQAETVEEVILLVG